MAVPRLGSRRLSRFPTAAIAAFIAAAGCEGNGPGLDEETYIDAMTRLSVATSSYLDEARQDSARAAVLDELGVPARALVEFAERHGDEPERMARIWETIRLRVDSIQRPPPSDSTGDESGLRRPGDSS